MAPLGSLLGWLRARVSVREGRCNSARFKWSRGSIIHHQSGPWTTAKRIAHDFQPAKVPRDSLESLRVARWGSGVPHQGWEWVFQKVLLARAFNQSGQGTAHRNNSLILCILFMDWVSNHILKPTQIFSGILSISFVLDVWAWVGHWHSWEG